MSTISKKICLIGDFGVGKTSLIRRFIDRQFSDRYLSTVGVKISRKIIEQPELGRSGKRELQLLMWDIEGSTKFKSIAPSYLQGAKGAIIVGDVTRQETLIAMPDHARNFLAINPQGSVTLALNKSDLVEAEKLPRLLQLVQVPHEARILATYTTSAKSGQDVDRIFQTLADNLLEQHELPV